MTLTDEGMIDGGVAKRRQQKVNVEPGLQNWRDTETVLAELIHLAGKKTISDYDLAVAVSKIPEYASEI